MVSAGSSTIPAPHDFLDQLHAEEFGLPGGRVLLMLQGWGSSAELMRPAAAGLEDSFRILNLDLPGHGRSAPPPEAWGVPEFAAVVAAYIESKGIQRATVLGHSNGGRIALFMASDHRYRHLFDRLVLIAPSGMTPQRPPSYYLKTGWIRLIKAPFQLLPEPLRGRGLGWLRTTIYWKLAASSDYQQASGVMRDTFVRTVTHHLDDRVHSIGVPTLIIRGDKDDAISDVQVERLRDSIPGAELVTLDGAGHYAYLDTPQPYSQAVHQFLAEHPATQPLPHS